MIRASLVLGHGMSMIGQKRGEYIDSFEFVFRFPYLGCWQTQEDFGTKTTYYCGTTKRIWNRLRKKLPDSGYFIWERRKGRGLGKEMQFLISKFGGKDVTALVKEWQGKLPDSAHPYLSHGTAGILIAAAEIGYPVVAMGCDDLSIGRADRSKYKGSWVFEKKLRRRTRGIHSFDCERQLIDEMSSKYNVKISFK